MANRFFCQFTWSLEKTPVSLWANIGVGDTSTVTTTADTAGDKAGTFFRVNGFVTGRQYMFWFKVSGSGTNPGTGADTTIEVDISTGATATTIATAIKTAADATAGFSSDFTLTRATNVLTFVALAPGCLNARDGLSMFATGFAFTNVSLPILDASKSKGVKSFTRTSTGIYVATFGTGAPTSVVDVYPRVLDVDYMAYAATGTPAAPYMFVVSQAVSSAGTVTIKFLAADGTTLTDPACGEEIWLEFNLKNTTAQ